MSLYDNCGYCSKTYIEEVEYTITAQFTGAVHNGIVNAAGTGLSDPENSGKISKPDLQLNIGSRHIPKRSQRPVLG